MIKKQGQQLICYFFTKLHDPKTNRFWIVDALRSGLVDGELQATEGGLLNLYDRTLLWRPAAEIKSQLESGAMVEWIAKSLNN